jgi:hypothetical protein
MALPLWLYLIFFFLSRVARCPVVRTVCSKLQAVRTVCSNLQTTEQLQNGRHGRSQELARLVLAERKGYGQRGHQM